MRPILVSLLLALAVACGSTTTSPSPQPAVNAPVAEAGKREDVSNDEFAGRIGAGVRLVDVRTPEEYAAGHLPGAVNIPLDDVRPGDERLGAKGEPLYLVCQSGRRSAMAADRLAAAGYHAINVLGGTAAWRSAGRTVE
jgi:rhodanese-related sulfurtransferase